MILNKRLYESMKRFFSTEAWINSKVVKKYHMLKSNGNVYCSLTGKDLQSLDDCLDCWYFPPDLMCFTPSKPKKGLPRSQEGDHYYRDQEGGIHTI